MKRFRTILFVAIVMAFSAIPAFSGPPTGVGAPPEMRILQASPQPPKEIQDLENEAKKQIPNPLGRQLTMGELEQKLQMIPAEREKLNNAKAGRKGNLTIMAAPPPREIQDLENEAKKQIPNPLGRQLTTGELEQKLQLIPAEQGKLQRIKQGYKPTSQAGETGFSLSWLNPFRVTEAWASTFDVTLSSANGWILSPSFTSPAIARAYFAGVLAGAYGYTNCIPLGIFYVNSVTNAFKGFSTFCFYAPVAGYYIIDVVAANKNRASLIADSFSGPAVATWDFASSTTFWNDHVSIQYLNAGNHWFYFKPEYNISGVTPVSSIRITSYP